MPSKFLVLKKEVYVVPVEVVANSHQNAVNLVRKGYGTEQNNFTYYADLPSSTWCVGEEVIDSDLEDKDYNNDK